MTDETSTDIGLDEDDEWLTRKEAAEFLGMSHHTLANWALDENISLAYYKVGKRVRYKKSDLIAFQELCKVL